MKKVNKSILFLLFICILSITALLTSCEALSSLPFLGDGDSEGSDSCKHESTEWIVDKNATCTEAGSRHKECLSCKASLEVAAIEKTKHTEQLLPGTEATCTESGLSAGKKCSVCETVLLIQQTISPKGHTEVTIPGKKATCTEKGLTDGKKCTVCDTVTLKQDEIPTAEHVASDWIIDVNADVGVAGSKHKECLVCKKPLATETIPALPENHVHEGSEWVTVTPATCETEGEKKFICSCGKTMESAPIGKLPHSEEVIPAVSATCKSTGLTEGKKCSSCGKILVPQSTTAKAPHTEETVLGVAPSCTESGLTDGKRCSVCTAVTVSQLFIPPTGHSFANGTCIGCGISEPYGVWIVDGQGNPVTDVIVKIMQNGEQVKMYPYKGEFLSLTLESGTYQIELDLSQLSTSYVFDASACELSPEKRTTTIRLFQTAAEREEALFVGAPISKDYPAYSVSVGATKVALTPNDYTFFVFAPRDAAIYTLTYECDTNLQISYHGGTFFVQGIDLTDDSSDINRYENGISINVYASNLGGEYVFGVKSTAATSCILSIKNVGDPGTRIEDAPWTPYLEDTEKVEEGLSMTPDGTYTSIDLTDLTVKAVYNESDGYYHLGAEDGPIIFIDLTTNSKFVSSIQTICGNQRMGAYIYDSDGNVVEKRSYNELFIQYGMPSSADVTVDSPIRVPLTAKLAEAIKSFGEKNSWWNPDSEANIFTSVLLGAPYNREYAWLLFCGYYA